MKDDLLKDLVMEIVRASPEYMKKERVRETVQDVILNMVKNGEIQSAQDLEVFFGTLDMSVKALKMVPFEVYAKMGGKA